MNRIVAVKCHEDRFHGGCGEVLLKFDMDTDRKNPSEIMCRSYENGKCNVSAEKKECIYKAGWQKL